MSDLIPKHNRNIVYLSELLQDPIGNADNGVSAATDGSVYSSVYREMCMADGYKWVGNQIIQKLGDKAQEQISGLIVKNTGTMTISTGSVSLPADYLQYLKVVRATASTPPYQFISPDFKPELDMDNIPDAKRVFTIYQNAIWSYTRTNGKLTADDSVVINIYYYKLERINNTTGALIAANTVDSRSSDVTLNPKWFESAVLYAAYLAKSRLGDADAVNDSARFLAMAEKCLIGTIG